MRHLAVFLVMLALAGPAAAQQNGGGNDDGDNGGGGRPLGFPMLPGAYGDGGGEGATTGEGRPDFPLPRLKAPLVNYRQQMRTIVDELAFYASKRDPGFLILADDGLGLVTRTEGEAMLMQLKKRQMGVKWPVKPETGRVQWPYVRNLDGLMLARLFCGRPAFNKRTPQDDRKWRLALLDRVGDYLTRNLTVERCDKPPLVDDAYAMADERGLLPYVATREGALDFLPDYPESPVGVNPAPVRNLDQAENLLVHLDSNPYPSKREWIRALADTDYDVLVLDGFFHGVDALTEEEIDRLQTKKMGARRLVFLRISVGYAKRYRYYFKNKWKPGNPSWLLNPVPDRPETHGVAFWQTGWKKIVGKFFKGAIDLGYDGVLLDDLDAWRPFQKEAIRIARKAIEKAKKKAAGKKPEKDEGQPMKIRPFTIP